MKIKKVTIELVNVNPIVRKMRFCIEDEEGREWNYEETLWESDAIDVVSIVFRNALRCFHDDMEDKEKGMKRI
jgi:hypothetical protein